MYAHPLTLPLATFLSWVFAIIRISLPRGAIKSAALCFLCTFFLHFPLDSNWNPTSQSLFINHSFEQNRFVTECLAE